MKAGYFNSTTGQTWVFGCPCTSKFLILHFNIIDDVIDDFKVTEFTQCQQ